MNCGGRSVERLSNFGLRSIVPTWPLGAHADLLCPVADRTITGVASIVAGAFAALGLENFFVDQLRYRRCRNITHYSEWLGALVITSGDAFEHVLLMVLK